MSVIFTLPALPLWLLLVDFLSHSVNANLTVRPTDTVVLINQTTYFNCSTSDRTMNKNVLLWYHYSLHSASREDVFDEGVITHEFMDRFRIEIDLSMGVFNLIAVRPRLADAGRYECQDGVGQGDRASAELTVLDETPSCESNLNPAGVIGQNDCGLQPDVIHLTCNVNSSRGNILPTLEWKLSGDRSNSSLIVCERSTSCILTLKANLTFNNQSFICQTTEARRQQYICSTGSVKVKYALHSEVSDVRCSANTSQSCTYKWSTYKNKEVSANENLGEQSPGDYICKAECEMNRENESCGFTAMEYHVEHSGQSGAPKGLYALLVIVIIIVIIIVIVLCYFIYKRREDRNKLKKPPNNDETGEVAESLVTSVPLDVVDSSLASLPVIARQDMVDTLAINDHYIDRGTSGGIYGPFRWKDKKCALKQIMFSREEITEELKENILQKSNVCMELLNKNVLKVFQVWLQPSALYIVMEYAEGRSLDKILRPKDVEPPYLPFSPDVIRDWALQIAEGMNYLHYNNLVHRNLKSAHVLVMGSPDVLPHEQQLKIGSYTSIKEHDHATVTSNRGTLAWMAPEYIRGEPFEKTSDVWSYGITVFEILTRDVPYKEMRKETDIVRAAINKTLMPTIPDSCPQTLKDLLTRCWNNEVKQRPAFSGICDDLREHKKWEPYITCPTKPDKVTSLKKSSDSPPC